jgi:hypothetical protein
MAHDEETMQAVKREQAVVPVRRTERTPEIRAAHAVRDELMRQLLLERRYDLLVSTSPSGRPKKLSSAVVRALEGFEFRVVTLPGLARLESAADRVLVRADGLNFCVAVITVAGDEGGSCERLALDELVEIGTRFTGLTGKIHGTTLPVTFQLFEIFPGEIPNRFVEAAAAYRRRGVEAPKVGVGVVAIDALSGRTWSNYPGLVRWSNTALARRAWRDRDMSREERAALLDRSGFQLGNALIGATAGALLGIAATWGLLSAEVTRGELYGAAVALASVIGAAISLKTCRVVHETIPQASVAGVAAAIAVIGVGHALGIGLGFGTLMTLLLAAMLAVMIGAVDNPQGRRR